MSNLKDKVRFYIIDCKTIPGKLIDILIILLNLMACALFVLETYPLSIHFKNILWQIEVIIVSLFVVEYIARFYGSPNRYRFVTSIYSIIDIFAILPTILMYLFKDQSQFISFFMVIRIFRILRVFRFIRFAKDPHFFFGTISLHLLKVLRLILTIFMIFFVSAGIFWAVENQINPNVNTFGDSFYFTIVALTTVGFGDITPISDSGRWTTIFMILSGIVLIPWQVSQIIKEWFLMSYKTDVTCKKCGLRFHDKDASNCKACGALIYQEIEDQA